MLSFSNSRVSCCTHLFGVLLKTVLEIKLIIHYISFFFFLNWIWIPACHILWYEIILVKGYVKSLSSAACAIII